MLNVDLNEGDELSIYDGGAVNSAKKLATYDASTSTHMGSLTEGYLAIFSSESEVYVTLKTGGNPGMGVLLGYQKGNTNLLH